MARFFTRRLLTYFLFFVLAVVVSLASHRYILLNGPITADENSYLFQAHTLLEGRVRRPVPPFPHQFKNQMIILDDEVGWLSRYPPGHPVWLMPGAAVGRPQLMTALAAGVGMVAIMGAASLLGFPAALPAVLLLISPFFIFMNGTLLSHTSGFMFSAVALWGFVKWHVQRHRAAAVITGLAMGALFTVRPYTAILLAIPYAIYALIRLMRYRERAYFVDGICLGLAGMVIMGLSLAYNYAAIGSLQSPYLYYAPSEGLGFGLRRTHGMAVNHTLERGLFFLKRNIGLLDQWLWGVPGGLVAAGMLAVFSRLRKWVLLFLALPVVLWAGYVYFWFPGITEVGPVYYFESLPGILLAVVAGLWGLIERLKLKRNVALVVCMVAVAGLAVTSAGFCRARAAEISKGQRAYRNMQQLLKQTPTNSLVIIEEVPDVLRYRVGYNLRGVKNDPLWLKDKQTQAQALARSFPSRTPFLLTLDNGLKIKPLRLDKPLIMRIDIHETPAQTGHNEKRGGKQEVRVAREDQNGEGFLSYGSYTYLCPGIFRVVYNYEASGTQSNAAVRLDVMKGEGERFLAYHHVRSDAETQTVFRIHAAEPMTVEPRAYYRGKGDFILYDIRIEEVPDA